MKKSTKPNALLMVLFFISISLAGCFGESEGSSDGEVLENSNDEIIIYSDSKNTVNELNHEFAINNDQLRSLAREAWSLIAKFSNLKLRWVPRSENLAGKMLGS